jgi:hypothetical protein
MKFLGNAFPGDGNTAFKLVDVLLRAPSKISAGDYQMTIVNTNRHASYDSPYQKEENENGTGVQRKH